MIIKNCSLYDLNIMIDKNSLFCFGAGNTLRQWSELFGYLGWTDKLCCVIDNSLYLSHVEIWNQEYKVYGVEKLIDEIKKRKIYLLITSIHYKEIIEQLDRIEELNNLECYIYFFMYNIPVEKISIEDTKNYKIPPIINYCWLGGHDKPDLYKRCIESWHEKCPSYEIIEWSEDNLDINECEYARDAYRLGKFGFVPDYFRLKIIYENGGIYLDTDVELLKNLDPLRCNEAFCGKQFPHEVAFGLGFGASKNNKIIKYLLKRYESLKFINNDGTLNTIASPYYQTKDLIELGMANDPRKQYLGGMCIYPPEVLSPINIFVGLKMVTENSFAIHHFDGSWVDVEKKEDKIKSLRYSASIINRIRKNEEGV